MQHRESDRSKMRYLVIGLGIQGKKRKCSAGTNMVGVVDPISPEADYKEIESVPLDSFDAAFVCTPDSPKLRILEYLVKNKKHALVEKPLFSETSNSLRELLLLSEECKTTIYTAYNHRFEPHFEKMRDLISSGELGKIYDFRMFYGNGTARDVRDSEWRDKGAGVLPDLGSHLLDTMRFWFPNEGFKFKRLSYQKFENRAPDHVEFRSNCSFQASLTATLLSWRNSFRVEILAEKGSAHIDCLCKWGPSTLTHRTRALPSGRPAEKKWTLTEPDPTWKKEFSYFNKLSTTGESNLENDIWINDILKELGCE